MECELYSKLINSIMHHIIQWDTHVRVITHPCPNFNGVWITFGVRTCRNWNIGSVEPPLELGHKWVTTYYSKYRCSYFFPSQSQLISVGKRGPIFGMQDQMIKTLRMTYQPHRMGHGPHPHLKMDMNEQAIWRTTETKKRTFNTNIIIESSHFTAV